MRVIRICGCSVLGALGALLILLSAFSKVAYFSDAPDVPIYLGVLLLILSGLSLSATLAKPQEDF